MAEESDKKPEGGGGKGLIIALVVLAVLGGGAGFGSGYFLGKDAPKRAAPAVAADQAAEGSAGAAAKPGDAKAQGEKHGEAAAGAEKAGAEKAGGEKAGADKAKTADGKAEPPPELQVLALEPIITNVSKPAGAWARIEASIVCNKMLKETPEIVRARVAEQIMIYLRSVSLSDVEGPSGLLNFRDDLNSLVENLNEGEVHEVLIRTLVVE